ncbi:MAG: MerR family transcriptional regulator [Anaerocolumna sp.]
MKKYYQINEISKLYGIGADSLRYYERIGVLKPHRGENGYRLYSLKDIYKLNIIRDLRRLDFSMKQIKEYLDYQSVDNTLKLLKNEQELIQKQLENLCTAEASIRSMMDSLAAFSEVTVGNFVIKTFPHRLCLQLNADISRDEETDFAIKKLQWKHDNEIDDLGNQSIGAIPSMEEFHKGVYGVFHSVFFILGQETKEYDFILPAGQYISYYYRGGYGQSPDRIKEVLHYAKAHDIEISGDPFELYHVDNRYTIRPEEFLTEIQVLIQ